MTISAIALESHMGTISSRFLHKNIESCAGLGIDESALTALVPGGEHALRNPIQRFEGDILLAIFQRAEILSGDPAIGFRCGLNHGHMVYSDLGHTISFCKNLHESFDVSAKYQMLVQQFGEYSLQIRGDEADIVWSTAEHAPTKMRHVTDLSFAAMARIGLWTKAVHDLSVKSMRVKHDNTSYKDLYNRIFECPIEFGAKSDALTFDRRFLAVSLPTANADVLAVLRARLDRDLAALEAPVNEERQVAAYLEGLLGKKPATLENVCKLMCMPERSLRRRLKENGTSFREILEQVRRERYELLIRQPELSQVQIAGLLGYSEQSAFSRAYKSWYGASPMKGNANI